VNHVAAFVGISAVVICTPGPDTALIVRNTLLGGRLNGVRTAGGIVTGIAVWTLAASAGIAAVIAASHAVFLALRVAGAAYLV
jgi:threonine/homoserine/homoserine lactone efflux protein